MIRPQERVAGLSLNVRDLALRFPVKIRDILLQVDQANVIFNGIPQNFSSLKLIGNARASNASLTMSIYEQFNGDTAANYDYQYGLGNATTRQAGEAFAQTQGQIANIPAATAPGGLWGGFEVLYNNYLNPYGNKIADARWFLKSGTATTTLQGGQLTSFWRSSVSISRILVLCGAGGNFVTGSRFTLYGLP